MTDPVRTHVLPTMGRDQQVRAAATVLKHARDLDDARMLLAVLFQECDGKVPCVDCGTRTSASDKQGKRRRDPRCAPCGNRLRLTNQARAIAARQEAEREAAAAELATQQPPPQPVPDLCRRGHRLTAVYTRPNGRTDRYCRTCRRHQRLGLIP